MTTNSDPAFVSKPAPEGYQYAGAWIRLGALIIDDLLWSAVVFALSFALLMGLNALLALTDLAVIPYGWGWLAGAVAYVMTSVGQLGWYGGWQARVGATPGMLALKLRVRDPSGKANPSLRAAVTRNLPQVLVTFPEFVENEGNSGIDIDALLFIVSLAVYIAIGITISKSPTRQGFHDRLAGGTYVVHRRRHTATAQE